MRKAVMALVAAALAGGPLCAQQVEPAKEWAYKLFEESSKDFGTHPKGAQLKHSFKITNIYKVPLDITITRVTCSCLTPTLSKKTLQPNESGTLDIVMDGTRFTGLKVINIFVTVGPQFVSTAMLTVQAVTRQDVAFNPGSINFGVVGKGQTPTQTIDVEYAGNLQWAITEIIKNASAPFTVEAKEIYRQEPQAGGKFGIIKPAVPGKVGYRLTLTLKAEAAAGPFKQELLLKTNDPTTPTLTVVAEGKIQATLTVTPPLVKLPSIKVGESKNIKVFVRGDRAFRITGIEGHGDGLSVKLPDNPAESQILTFQFEPTTAGEFRRQIRIRTDLDNETAMVTIEANVTAKE